MKLTSLVRKRRGSDRPEATADGSLSVLIELPRGGLGCWQSFVGVSWQVCRLTKKRDIAVLGSDDVL